MRTTLNVLPPEPTASGAFAAQVRRYRRAAGLTQEALAERAGLSVRGISDLERGLKAPQRATVDLLARARETGDRDKVGIALYVRSCAARSAGEFDRARPYAEESVALLRAAGDAYFLAAALGDLGFIAEEDGNPAAARRAFGEAIALAGNTAHLYVRARSLAGLAGVALLEGDPVQSARLFAAAEATMERQGAALARADRRTAEPQLAAVRAQLGPAAFAAAWAEGRTMTLEQAVAEALRDGD